MVLLFLSVLLNIDLLLFVLFCKFQFNCIDSLTFFYLRQHFFYVGARLLGLNQY